MNIGFSNYCTKEYLMELSKDTIDKILESIDKIEAQKHEKTDDGWSVYIYHSPTDIGLWIDCYINEKYHDIEADWNQYIFHLDYIEDILKRDIQNNCYIYDYFTSEAIYYLESKNLIYQNDEGQWYKKDGKKNCIFFESNQTATKLYFISENKDSLLNNQKLLFKYVECISDNEWNNTKKMIESLDITILCSEDIHDEEKIYDYIENDKLNYIKKYLFIF